MQILQIIEKYIDGKIYDIGFIDLLLKNADKLNNIDKKILSKIDSIVKRKRNDLRQKLSLNIDRNLLEKMRDTDMDSGVLKDIEHMIPESVEIENKIQIINNQERNLSILIDDLISIGEINQNFMIGKKINVSEYLTNLRTLIISEGTFPLKNIKRFTKTLRDLIDENLFPEYRLLLPPKITLEIGKTVHSATIHNGHNYCMVLRPNFKVRSYDLHNLSLLLKNTDLMLGYLGDVVFKQLDDSGVFYSLVLELYQQIFPKLPFDVLRYIFEFSSVPFLKIQKQIEQAPQENLYTLKSFQKAFNKK